jgi:hypothetical protein
VVAVEQPLVNCTDVVAISQRNRVGSMPTDVDDADLLVDQDANDPGSGGQLLEPGTDLVDA